ncbi:DUF5333 domain-containing protein [Roseivivax isoporae]|uniref:NADH dehydrogenase subunit E n=1 Tax=Roseivivax isoporae LMG 25204 TaxID=1449351 RepID=X7F9K9_9RHOB|nr:DUF5333 domain-containing protein [Roseivivax isoporae]ETX29480.1 hypothetical protein RISW2_23375 [Roseivivax isoporae LMG 25204]
MRRTAALAAMLALSATLAVPAAAQAKPPLREVSEIDDGLMAVAIADQIRKSCDGISARMIRAYSRLNTLKSRAESLGYSSGEIEDYVTSKDEKRRMRAKAERYLAQRGVDAADETQLCRFGRAEIASNTAIGSLLR